MEHDIGSKIKAARLEKKLTQEQKPSIRKALSAFKEAAKQLNADRQKVKNQTRGGIER